MVRIGFVVFIVAMVAGGAPAAPTGNGKPLTSFRAFAAAKLGVPADKLAGGGAVDEATAKMNANTVGSAWAYAFIDTTNPVRDARGWAMPDGTVVTSEQNLGLLFTEAGVWTKHPTRTARELAEILAWSFGMGNAVAKDSPLQPLPPPALDVRAGGDGQLRFVLNFRPAGPGGAGGGPDNLSLITVTLTSKHAATLARAPYDPSAPKR